MHDQSSKTSGNRNLVSGFLRFFVLSLLTAAFAFTSLHAQTVAYVANFNNTVSVIDTASNTVTVTIPVGETPFSVVVAPDGSRAYVANAGFSTGNSSISVIDTASNTVVATIPLPAFSFPGVMGITPDGKTLYLPLAGFNQSVLAISTVTNSVIVSIPIPASGVPEVAAVTADGVHVYILGDGFFSVIDTATNAVSAGPISLDSNSGRSAIAATAIAFSLSGNLVYMPGAALPDVPAVSTASNTVSTEVTLPDPSANPVSVVITPDGSRLFVLDQTNDLVNIIDTATNTVEPSTIPVGSVPNGMAITPDGALLYVANLSDSTVSVINTATNTVVATVSLGPAGQTPEAVAIANLHAPMATLNIENLVINSNLHEQGDFTLAANTSGIDLAHQPVAITVNNFSLTIPAGSFKQVGGNMHFVFNGTVNGLKVNFNIQAEHGSSTQFDFVFDVHGVSITGPNPATVSLGIGPNTGSTTVPF